MQLILFSRSNRNSLRQVTSALRKYPASRILTWQGPHHGLCLLAAPHRPARLQRVLRLGANRIDEVVALITNIEIIAIHFLDEHAAGGREIRFCFAEKIKSQQ